MKNRFQSAHELFEQECVWVFQDLGGQMFHEMALRKF